MPDTWDTPDGATHSAGDGCQPPHTLSPVPVETPAYPPEIATVLDVLTASAAVTMGQADAFRAELNHLLRQLANTRTQLNTITANHDVLVEERDAYGDTLANIAKATEDGGVLPLAAVAKLTIEQRGYLPWGRLRRAEQLLHTALDGHVPCDEEIAQWRTRLDAVTAELAQRDAACTVIGDENDRLGDQLAAVRAIRDSLADAMAWCASRDVDPSAGGGVFLATVRAELGAALDGPRPPLPYAPGAFTPTRRHGLEAARSGDIRHDDPLGWHNPLGIRFNDVARWLIQHGLAAAAGDVLAPTEAGLAALDGPR